jgi:hypothetical protein
LNRKKDAWKLDYKGNSIVKVGGVFDETIADGAVSRTGGLTFTFNAEKGSPLSVFYGSETSDSGGHRRSFNRYELKYDQRITADRKLGLMLGNTAYERTLGSSDSSGLTLRVDYQIRF